jgi:hypothetical protein
LIFAEEVINALLERELIIRPIEFSTALKLNLDNTVLCQMWEQINHIPIFDTYHIVTLTTLSPAQL